MPLARCQVKPPLLHTYTAPSGPTAAPFGPPPSVATTSVRPCHARVNVPRAISTSSTEPSGIAIGPSGNCKPSATISNCMVRSRALDHELGRRIAQVVAGAHRAAVGASGCEQQHIAFLSRRQQSIDAELVSRFADRSHDVHDVRGEIVEPAQV